MQQYDGMNSLKTLCFLRALVNGIKKGEHTTDPDDIWDDESMELNVKPPGQEKPDKDKQQDMEAERGRADSVDAPKADSLPNWEWDEELITQEKEKSADRQQLRVGEDGFLRIDENSFVESGMVDRGSSQTVESERDYKKPQDSEKTGCRVFLTRDYSGPTAFTKAICSSIKHMLVHLGVDEDLILERKLLMLGHMIVFPVFVGEEALTGIIDIEPVAKSYSIMFIISGKSRSGRMPLLAQFCQEKSYGLYFGKLAMDRNGGIQFQVTVSYAGAFSEEAFAEHYEGLLCDARNYTGVLKTLASAKKLSEVQILHVRELLLELADNLPPEDEAERKKLLLKLEESSTRPSVGKYWRILKLLL